MAFERVHRTSSQTPQTSWSTSQFAPRPFPVQEPKRSPTQEGLENQAFQQNQFEATELQLKEKDGTITPIEQEKLGLLQAKMDSFWVQRNEQAKVQPNLLEILIRNAQSTQATEPSAPVQPKLTIGQPNDPYEQEADRVASQVVDQSNAPVSNPFTTGHLVQRQEENIQREVDNSSITQGLQHVDRPDRGVPEWAQEEYKVESKRTVICSLSEGKIGSIYFEDGRIRTIHSAGPAKESHEGQTIVQFNLNEEIALKKFKKTNPRLIKDPKFWNYFDEWLATALAEIPLDQLPEWISVIDKPEAAYDMTQGSPPQEIKLFEIFKSINGELQGWHPSRGLAAKYETDKQLISVLNAAIGHIEQQGLVEPGQRNEAFYNFVQSRLPQHEFINYMRHPNTV